MAKFENIGIVGLGLIGGSLAIDVKSRGIARKVTGFSRRLSTLKKAKEQGIIDEYFSDFEKGLKGLDFLIISTPINAVKDCFVKISQYNPSLLLTDASSIKERIVKEAKDVLGEEANFVGSHPMAGSEKSGLEAAKKNLFQGRFVVITPSRYTKEKNVQKVRDFWDALGAIICFLSPEQHDKLIALTSHIPHFMVYVLLALFRDEKNRDVLASCIGKGFLDTTRIGKSNPELWAEIFIANRKNIALWITEFEKALAEMKNILEKENCGKLAQRLDDLKKTREYLDGKKKDF